MKLLFIFFLDKKSNKKIKPILMRYYSSVEYSLCQNRRLEQNSVEYFELSILHDAVTNCVEYPMPGGLVLHG
jgi:hypothetical protein